jgi:chromosomal replication initiator protein
MKEWQQFLSQIEQELGPEIVKKWIPQLLRFDAANIYLEVRDSFQANWFEEHIRPKLKGFVNENQRPLKVHLLTETNPNKKKQESPPLSFLPDPIDPEMTLENYIPSEKNQVVYQLLTQNSPFNPIYLYGQTGSGKTHLMMGAALFLQKSGKRIFFVGAEAFTEHVVQAIRMGKMQEFRKVYRDIDALLIDDIHLFSRRTATQEEFFHTFNTLHTLGCPILISSAVPPSQLSEIEPRLVSRFEWGISLEVSKIDPLLILQRKAQLWKIDLKPELLDWIAEKFTRNPILALQALALRAKGAAPTITIAEKLLRDLLEKEQAQALTPERIVKNVAAHYGITSEDILGKSQTRTIALPRQIAMYLCREKLELPFQKIGEIFSRDHSTVISSIKQIQKAIEKKELNSLESLIQ